MSWLDRYQREVDLAEAGIREQETIIHVKQREIEHAEYMIRHYKTIIATRKQLLEHE